MKIKSSAMKAAALGILGLLGSLCPGLASANQVVSRVYYCYGSTLWVTVVTFDGTRTYSSDVKVGVYRTIGYCQSAADAYNNS